MYMSKCHEQHAGHKHDITKSALTIKNPNIWERQLQIKILFNGF